MANIDVLQIEIESNSLGASKNIQALGDALGNLKKNGTFSTAVNNMDKLRKSLQLFNGVPSNYSKIVQLKDALEKLSEVKSVSNIGTTLKKLAEGMRELGGANISTLGPKIREIAAAIAPLSEIKSGGIGTMVNGLSKIKEVTTSLDKKTIEEFAKRVETLTAKLSPLSEKMATIKTGFSGINSKARSAGAGAKQMGEDLDNASINFSSFIHIIQNAYHAINNIIQKFKQFISSAVEWDGISARFGRGFGVQAQETYAWIQRLNEEMGINVQQFMQYSSVYATMLNGFGVANEDAAKMALGYTELTYDIWAGYNDIYKSFAEAADAVRSAISGEVEPVRRAGFTIVESSLEQTAANHGLKISLEKATEAQKSYLRYLTLIDQAHDQGLVGTYAKELDTAEGLLRTASQQVKSLSQAFGSLFLPILIEIMPYMQAFVELLTDAVRWLANLFGITIQSVDWSEYNNGVGSAVENTENLGGAINGATAAAKELKNATLGFDELNVISPPASSGGGSGAGNSGSGFNDLDVDSLWDDSIFANIGSQVDAIKEKLEGWMPVIGTIAGALGALTLVGLVGSIGNAIEKMNLLGKTAAGLATLVVEAVLVFAFADNYLESGNLLSLLGEAIVTAGGGYLAFKAWGDKGVVAALAVSIAAQLVAITMNLADGGVEMDDPQLWLQAAFTSALGGVAGGWLSYKGLIKMPTGKGIGLGVLAGVSLSLTAITIGDVSADGKVTGSNILTALGSTLAAAGFGFTVGGPWGALIGAAVGIALNVIGMVVASVSKNAEKALKDDLSSRFGKIELDENELKFYVDKITAIPRSVTINQNVWNEKLGEYEIQTMTVSVDLALGTFKDENALLQTIQDRVAALEKELDSKNIKIVLGMEVSHDDYSATIDSYVSAAQEYLDQYYLTTNIALDITGADTDGSLATALDTFYLENTAKLSDLGAKLKTTVSDAFVDGEWIPDKLEEARKIQAEIQEVLSYISDVEYRATMQNLTLEVTGDLLTPESFSGVLNGAQEAIEDKLATLEEVKMSQLKVAIMEYDANIAAGVSEAEAKAIYDQTVADIEAAYEAGVVEVEYGTVEFGLDTIKTAFETEIKRAKDEGWFNYEEKINLALSLIPPQIDADDYGDVYLYIQEMMGSVSSFYKEETEKISPEVKQNLSNLLAQMEPTIADYNKIAEECKKAGKAVPQNVREGLNDYNELKALTGDAQAINYMLGKQFSTDPVFINTLATMEGAGAVIPDSIKEGLTNNLDVLEDAAAGTVTILSDGVALGTYDVTPALVDNMEELGVNLSEGLLSGAESGMEGEKKGWLEWALWPWNWFKKENEINSPSKLFKRGGGWLVEGLWDGVNNSKFIKNISGVWDWISDIFKGNKDDPAEFIVKPKNESSSWWKNVKSWWGKKVGEVESFKTNVANTSGTWWNNTKKWWSDKVGDVDSFKTNVVNQAGTWWSNVKQWWSDKVGSVESFTTNVKNQGSTWWSNTKKWWSDNVGTGESFKTNVKNQADTWWSNVKTWWSGKTGNAGSFTVSVQNTASTWWENVKTWWNNTVGELKMKIKTPTVTVKWNYDIPEWQKTVASFLFDKKALPKLDVEWKADGGFVNEGQMFIAREAGPEMVGRIGSRNAVANNDQIVTAISEGVYSAVIAAMSGNSNQGDQNINIYLDGKKITASVEKHQKERGANLMTGGMAYGY